MQISPLMNVKKIPFVRLNLLLVAALLSLGLVGCKTTDYTAAMEPPGPETDPGVLPQLHVGDTVTITFTGLEEPPPPQEKPIKEDGTITLPDIGRVQAAGKTAGELGGYHPRSLRSQNLHPLERDG